MPGTFVKQPDGKLARFSSVVDEFTHMNMSREEAIDVAQDYYSRRVAAAEVDRGINDEVDKRDAAPRQDGLKRWHACLETIEMVHGKAIADAYRAKYPVAQDE